MQQEGESAKSQFQHQQLVGQVTIQQVRYDTTGHQPDVTQEGVMENLRPERFFLITRENWRSESAAQRHDSGGIRYRSCQLLLSARHLVSAA